MRLMRSCKQPPRDPEGNGRRLISWMQRVRDRLTSEWSGRRAAAAHPPRVCQAWHRAHGVEVPVPGIRGAEGEEKGKGAIAR
jgi:hypothetical protein